MGVVVARFAERGTPGVKICLDVAHAQRLPKRGTMWPFTHKRRSGKLFEGPDQRRARPVPRDGDDLPPMVLVPVPKGGFSYAALAEIIRRQAPDKELVCLVKLGGTASPTQAMEHIEKVYDFADDPRLVIMRFRDNDQVVIRASFMHDTASTVTANDLGSLATALSRAAAARGLKSVIA